MNHDRHSLVSRLRLREITQPITRSAREHFAQVLNHQAPGISNPADRCPPRHRAEPPVPCLPNGPSSPGNGGMAVHHIQIPSMADAGLRYSLNPHQHPQRQPAFSSASEYAFAPEGQVSPVGLRHPQDGGWHQHSSHYISFGSHSPPRFPPSYSTAASPSSVFHQINPILHSQYHPDLSSFVPPPTSSAAPPISEPFQSPSHPRFRSNHHYTPHTASVQPPAFVSPESPLFLPGCPLPSPDHYHTSFNQQSAQYHHFQCSPHSNSPSPSASVPRSFLAAQQQPQVFERLPPPVFQLNPIKRPLQASSNSSSGHSHQTIFAVPSSKHSKPTKVDPPALFDHLQPYLYSPDPFSLDNSSELNHPHALVFPTAKQELDPDFRRFPKGPAVLNQTKDRMVNNKASDKTSTASNHNLVGHRIDGGRLEFMSVLGLGAYGVVYLARDLQSPDMEHPRLYAVKALNKIGLDARQKSFQRREIALHSLASSHPSIVTLHAVIESPSCIFVILDYCPDGDLFGMITEKQKYLSNTELIKQVFIQIVEAVQFCHRLGISHRDLKPENILCKKNGADVVLADFGLATSERTSSDFGCGSTFYMSPECQGGLFQRLGSYSTLHNDIWSLGVILVNLTCGRNPWKQACPTDETFRAYLANPDFLRSILPVSDSCNKILKRIFALNPLARISLAELKTEIAKVETFNMTNEELAKSTKATREAARAWRQDVPPSPKPEPQAQSASWKNTLAKKTKKQHRQNSSNGKAQRHPIPADGSVWDQPVRYEESSSSSSATFYDNTSNDSSLWNYPATRPSVHQQRLQNQLKSPINGLRGPRAAGEVEEDDATPRIRFVSPPPTPRTPQRPHVHNAIVGRVPTGPLVNAFTSASISSNASSSSSSGDWNKKTRAFTSRFGVRKHVNFAPSAGDQTSESSPPSNGSTRKKLLMKPLSFNRPNAPSPIILKPSTPDSSASSSSSRSRVLVTPTIKKGKHSTLTFLPSTPPSSASPNATTFGFVRKQTKFFPQEMPPTPSTPTHPDRLEDGLVGHPPRRRVNKAPVPPKKKFDANKFSLFSSSDEEGSEGGNVDADFDVEEDDDDDDEAAGGYRNTYPAYAEWVMINEPAVAATNTTAATKPIQA